MAGVSSRRRRQFSAKLKCTSGKKRAPGILALSTMTRSPRVAAITPQKSHKLSQNFSISAMEKRCKTAYEPIETPHCCSTCAMNAVKFAVAIRSALGCQSGLAVSPDASPITSSGSIGPPARLPRTPSCPPYRASRSGLYRRTGGTASSPRRILSFPGPAFRRWTRHTLVSPTIA
jgi:hypothetical protein